MDNETMRGGGYQWYLDELEGNYLEVVLTPSRDPECAMRGGMLRAVQYQNCNWYREFCGCHESSRRDRLRWSKFKTSIKRAHTIRALHELIDGKCQTPYAKMVKSFLVNYERNQRVREEIAQENVRRKTELSVQTGAALLVRWEQVPV